MTIDVGYAHLTFDDGVELDFVDVPGHDRLIGNMLVGAGEIDAAMLVVAADDGPRPQTIEHLQLLDALGIDDGLAVVTKVDVVEAARVEGRPAGGRCSRNDLASCRAGCLLLSVEGVEMCGTRCGRCAMPYVASAKLLVWSRRPRNRRASPSKGRGAWMTGTLWGAAWRGATLRREPGGEGFAVARSGPGRRADRHDCGQRQ